MPNLAPIIYNSETISARHAPSLNAAFKELFEASGIKPRVLTPDGGARTKEECIALGLDWRLSDHYEDSPKGRAAIDLDNQRTFRNWNEPLFLAIMAKHGWHNIQINGLPFPSEPWHFANHDASPQQAGTPGRPLEKEEDPMYSFFNTTKDPSQPADRTWVNGPAGCLPVDNPYHLSLLQRALVPGGQGLLEGEAAIVNSYLVPGARPVPVNAPA